MKLNFEVEIDGEKELNIEDKDYILELTKILCTLNIKSKTIDKILDTVLYEILHGYAEEVLENDEDGYYDKYLPKA
ncbi:MAG: hypothetical protein Q4B60_09760 [Erysipelotrichaceae bacterium]|nr:hypothetical protein [Erysipelotrichaceae bacterium]